MKYLGIKIVESEPMSEFDFMRLKGATPSDQEVDRPGYKVTYEDGYVSWSPKDVFEKAYRPINGLTFGLAIEALKQGKKVAREGWNGKGMYLKLIQSYPVNGHLQPCNAGEEPICQITAMPEWDPCLSPNITQGNAGQMLSHIIMKTAGNSKYWGAGYSDYIPWLASQTDVLAEDWVIVE